MHGGFCFYFEKSAVLNYWVMKQQTMEFNMKHWELTLIILPTLSKANCPSSNEGQMMPEEKLQEKIKERETQDTGSN